MSISRFIGRTFVFFLLAFFELSCSGEGTIYPKIDSNKKKETTSIEVKSCEPLKALKWKTSGAWAVEFEVSKTSTDQFLFNHIFIGRKKVPYSDFSLFKNNDPGFFQELDAFFRGDCNTSQEISLTTRPTGIWSSVTLVGTNDQERIFGRIRTDPVKVKLSDGTEFSLQALEEFVIQHTGYPDA